jgi:predicted MPP superfamily phosphohydrolase
MAINKKHFSNYIFLIVFIASYIMFLLYAVNNNIKEAHYTLSKPLQYKSEKGLKIAHVSDLHNTIHNNSQKDLTDRIRGYNPDLIFLTGDIADDKFDFNGTLLFLEQTKDVAPIYYVTGNHEYWSSSLKQNIESMEQYGLKYLDNQTEKININGEDITITGINDPSSYEPATSMDKIKFIDEALKGQDYEQESLNLLLFHRPEYVDIFNKYNFDIIFAGHAHGGQITLPFLVNGFYAPNQGFFPKYAGGLYELLNSSLVVSRGLSIHYLPRIFNPPELVFVTVTN